MDRFLRFAWTQLLRQRECNHQSARHSFEHAPWDRYLNLGIAQRWKRRALHVNIERCTISARSKIDMLSRRRFHFMLDRTTRFEKTRCDENLRAHRTNSIVSRRGRVQGFIMCQ